MANISYNPPMGIGGPGAVTQGGAGGGYTWTGAHSILDARRMMATGRTPSAEYPDGYLGTITDRREDRLLDAVQTRLNDRSYQRGVHVGSRVPPQSYFWPERFNMDTALRYQARGRKWTAHGDLTPPLAHLGKVAVTDNDGTWTPAQQLAPERQATATPDPERVSALRNLAPSWK
jgi:hypothetical protein